MYSALSVEHSADYEVVKREILNTYELVPGIYRQQFCEIQGGTNLHGIFPSKRGTFNRWYTEFYRSLNNVATMGESVLIYGVELGLFVLPSTE